MNGSLDPAGHEPAGARLAEGARPMPTSSLLPCRMANAEALRAVLIRERFERTLEILAQLGLYRKSPKFFIVYAHNNAQFPECSANAERVKDIISWFKKLQFDVDSDRSP